MPAWIIIVIVVIVLLAAGGATYLFRNKLKGLLSGKLNSPFVAHPKKPKGPPSVPPPPPPPGPSLVDAPKSVRRLARRRAIEEMPSWLRAYMGGRE